MRPRKAAPEGVFIPRDLEVLILTCLAESPERRYQDMKTLGGAIRAVHNQFHGKPWQRLPVRRLTHAIVPVVGGVFCLSLLGLIANSWLHKVGHSSPVALAKATPVEAPMPLQVEVRSAPPGAEVRYGGALLGTTPCVVRIPEGRREVELRRAGYRREKRTLNVRVGARLSVRLTRTPKTGDKGGDSP